MSSIAESTPNLGKDEFKYNDDKHLKQVIQVFIYVDF